MARLSKKFERVVSSSEVRRALKSAKILRGYRAFHDKRAAVIRYINGGWGRVYEWHVDGYPNLLILSEKHGRAILKKVDFSVHKNRAPFLGQWQDVRGGKSALLVFGAGTSKVFVMHEELVQKVLEVMEHKESIDGISL